MAAITVSELHPASVVGYEVNEKGMAATNIARGQLLVLDPATTPGSGFQNTYKIAPAGATKAHGICLKDAKAGGLVDVGVQGVMEGYTGLVEGTDLFPSASIAGGIDTAALTTPSQILALTKTAIRYNFG